MKIWPLIFYEAPAATEIDQSSREDLILDEEIGDDELRNENAHCRSPLVGVRNTFFTAL
jgi:hypothetical protein